MSLPNLEPMLPQIAPDGPFDHPDWTFEPKLDGFRSLIYRDGDSVRMISRRGVDNAAEFPWLVELVRGLDCQTCILDGELVAYWVDQSGVPTVSFNALQNRKSLNPYMEFIAFDLLYQDGLGIWKAGLGTRREGLKQLLPARGRLRYGDTVRGEGKTMFEVCVNAGFEGVVAKRIGSPYQPGKRSDVWLKIKKAQRDEFVIGGYTPGTGARASTFGALILGYYPEGELDETFPCLHYVGNVGTGFDQATLARLLPMLRARHQPGSPFSTQGPKPTAGARAPGPIQWLTPDLVADIGYQERTKDGILRFPVFFGLRDDKTPQEAGRGT